MSTQGATLESPLVSDGTGEPWLAHLCKKDQLIEAIVNGTPIEALCGKVFVPSRDPDKYPMCKKCTEIREVLRGVS